MIKSVVLALATAAAALGATTAHAGGVSWSIGINAPPVGAVVSSGRGYYEAPRYYEPATVYAPVYAPAPVYVPAPVYRVPPRVAYYPPAVVYSPAPVVYPRYYPGYGRYYHERHERRDWYRDHDRGWNGRR